MTFVIWLTGSSARYHTSVSTSRLAVFQLADIHIVVALSVLRETEDKSERFNTPTLSFTLRKVPPRTRRAGVPTEGPTARMAPHSGSQRTTYSAWLKVTGMEGMTVTRNMYLHLAMRSQCHAPINIRNGKRV